jgi:hypothetical protein
MTHLSSSAAQRAVTNVERMNDQPPSTYVEYEPWAINLAEQLEPFAPNSARHAAPFRDALGNKADPAKAPLIQVYRETYPKGKGPWTPWGPATHGKVLQEGVVVYTTDRHGGIGITKKVAQQYLTAAARRAGGPPEKGKYWFEEDEMASIPYFEQEVWAKASSPEWFAKGGYTEMLEEVLGSSGYESYRKDRVDQAPETYTPEAKPRALQEGDTLVVLQPLSLGSGRKLEPGAKLELQMVQREHLVTYHPEIGLIRLRKDELTAQQPRVGLTERP